MKTFRSRIDSWFLLLMLAITGICLWAAAVSWPQSIMVALLVVATGVVLPGWIVLDTCYRVDNGQLLIRSGPMRWTIPLASITAVTPSRSLISAPALSLNRLRIDYTNSRYVLVSPAQPEMFIEALQLNGNTER